MGLGGRERGVCFPLLKVLGVGGVTLKACEDEALAPRGAGGPVLEEARGPAMPGAGAAAQGSTPRR